MTAPRPDGVPSAPAPEARTERLEVRITPRGKGEIERLAAAEGRTFADMTRVLLGRGVAASPRPRPLRPAPKRPR